MEENVPIIVGSSCLEGILLHTGCIDDVVPDFMFLINILCALPKVQGPQGLLIANNAEQLQNCSEMK